MYNCFLSQFLVLILLLVSGSRIFFLKNPRIDCFAAFSPIAFLISIINFFCFDVSFLNLLIFFIALFSFFTNFRSVLRLRSKLIVDHYGNAFLISTIAELILILISLVFLILHRPAKLAPQKFNAEKTEYLLTGNTTNELRIKTDFFKGQKTTGYLYVYTPKIAENDEINAEIYSGNPVLIFAGSPSGPALNYEPYFLFLAQKGFTVLAADFYTRDTKILGRNLEKGLFHKSSDSKFLRYFYAQILKISDEEKFNEINSKEISLAPAKYNSITKLAGGLFGTEKKIFYLVDGIDFDTIYSIVEQNKNASAFYSLNRIDEYKTGGFGFLEQTDPVFAAHFGLRRDPSLFIPRYAANKTIENIIR